MSLKNIANKLGLGKARLHVKYADRVPKEYKTKSVRTLECPRGELVTRIIAIEHAFDCTVMKTEWNGKMISLLSI